LNKILALPKQEPGYQWANVTKEMKDTNAFKTLRTEIKTVKGFYKRLEALKKKGKK
jgi:hypothetical protein